MLLLLLILLPRRGFRPPRHSGRPMKEDMSIEFIDFISVCSPLIPPICRPSSPAPPHTDARRAGPAPRPHAHAAARASAPPPPRARAGARGAAAGVVRQVGRWVNGSHGRPYGRSHGRWANAQTSTGPGGWRHARGAADAPRGSARVHPVRQPGPAAQPHCRCSSSRAGGGGGGRESPPWMQGLMASWTYGLVDAYAMDPYAMDAYAMDAYGESPPWRPFVGHTHRASWGGGPA